MKSAEFLITGSGGMLGSALVDVLTKRGAGVTALDKSMLDVTNADAVRAALTQYRPTVVIQCAAFTRVDDAESDPSRAHAVNADGARNVAEACGRIGARFVYPSTDYVFDGTANVPYTADATPNPINEYGRSKLAGETAAQEAADHLVLRTSWLYGPRGKNFVRTIVDRLRENAPLRIVDDQYGSPTWTIELATRIVALVSANIGSGIYHMTATGHATWYDLALETAKLLDVEPRIARASSTEYETAAQRPSYSVLDCARTDQIIGAALEWREALARAIAARAY